MQTPRIKACSDRLLRCIPALPALWRETWPSARPAVQAIDVALHPSPLARRAGWLFLATQLGYALHLLLLGHAWMAATLGGLAAGWCWWWRRQRREAVRRPRRLLITTDARIHLVLCSGAIEAVSLHPSSMCMGAWLLLRLIGVHQRWLLLLGPDNLDVSQLAALRRRVAMGGMGAQRFR